MIRPFTGMTQRNAAWLSLFGVTLTAAKSMFAPATVLEVLPVSLSITLPVGVRTLRKQVAVPALKSTKTTVSSRSVVVESTRTGQ